MCICCETEHPFIWSPSWTRDTHTHLTVAILIPVLKAGVDLELLPPGKIGGA